MSPPTRILVAPDKFKGTLTAVRAAAAISSGVLRAVPDARIRELPVADGGEGTVDAVVAAGGQRHRTTAVDPLGGQVQADWASIRDWAVIELAAASGLQLVEPSTATAGTAHTTGTGQLVRAALDAGFRRIAVGLGGSASTDGGSGLLSELGARFTDHDGSPVHPGGAGLTRIEAVDLAGLDPRLTESELVVCCDVATPLLGQAGAAAVFGPQKGADPSGVAMLESSLRRFAHVMLVGTGRDAAGIGWGGAAGGAAGGLYAALGAGYESGFDRVAGLLDLDSRLADADLVVVGEGRLDHQSLTGKAPVALARRARAHGVPAVAVVGALEVDAGTLAAEGIVAAASARELGGAAALAEPVRWVARAAERAIHAYLDPGARFSARPA